MATIRKSAVRERVNNPLNIKVHRGTHQIGGCVTEYEYDGWHLFVDYGEELPGAPKSGDICVEGLTHGDLSKSALLITHYHGDHIGSITKLPKELPIFMGGVGREIQRILSNRLKSVSTTHKEMLSRLEDVRTFEAGRNFSFGPFTIMPIVMDHSAFDAYAFRIEGGGVTAFHTGDFRTHGFRSKKLPEVIRKYVGEVNYVVCEGTNVSRPTAASLPEHELQKQFKKAFAEHKSNIVYVSSTNVDRLFALYHAAIAVGRKFLVDNYQMNIMEEVVKRDTMWGKSNLYKFKEGNMPMVLQFEDGEFRVNDKFKWLLDQTGYVLIARANPLFDDFIERIPGEKLKYLSMWKGYVDPKNEAYNDNMAASVGKKFLYIHTSGHCDMDSLNGLFQMLHPRAIIPIHTDNPETFAKLFCKEWPIIVLNDGDLISPFTDSCVDSEYAMVVSGKKRKCIGYFKSDEDARIALAHTVFGTTNKTRYEIIEEEDATNHKREEGLLSSLKINE